MQPRLTLLTLGVAEVARARAFYERLGFVASSASTDGVAFFPAGGVVLALWAREDMAKDTGVAGASPATSSVTLAHNVGNEAEVDAALAQATAAGGRLVKPAHRAFWGGYTGYFADPDGYLWEVAYNPAWPLDGAGQLVLPPPKPHA